MRVFQTLPNYLKIGRIFFVFLIMNISAFFIFADAYYFPMIGCINFLFIMIMWQLIERIYRHHEHPLPTFWLFMYIVSNVKFIEPDNDWDIDDALDWCRKNCLGYYCFTNVGYFIFSEKSDLIAFKLMWT